MKKATPINVKLTKTTLTNNQNTKKIHSTKHSKKKQKTTNPTKQPTNTYGTSHQFQKDDSTNIQTHEYISFVKNAANF